MTNTSSGRGRAGLESSEIYADLRDAGSLTAALERVIAELKLDVVRSHIGDQVLSAALGAAPHLHRAPIAVSCAAYSRSFLLSGRDHGVYAIVGATSDLHEVARAAASWQSGAAFAEIQRIFPWITVDEMAFANERGPADAVILQWSKVRAQMREPMHDGRRFDPGFRAVEAAYAEPRLRELFPYTSHWVLGFSRCTGEPLTCDVPWIVGSEKRYQVRWPGWTDTTRVIGEPATAEEAVALVVAKLPKGCGAAVAGTADDL